jgi:NitT/TauT family transport system permease protein
MIFTAQAWNMTFSMFGSIKNIPAPLREAATVYRLGAWRVFRVLELPASMIGLVWNSMMSMAGGWFVLTISEAFTLQNRDFRLPGLGSYMGEAINNFDPHIPATWSPIGAAIVAMVIMIVAVDQLFWRPIVVWSERFKMEETAEVDKPQSWVLDLLQDSRIYIRGRNWFKARAEKKLRAATVIPARQAALATAVAGVGAGGVAPASANGNGPAHSEIPDEIGPTRQRAASRDLRLLTTVGGWLVVALLAVGSVWGLWALGKLLWALPVHDAGGADWVHVFGGLGASFLRTSASILIGAVWTLPLGIVIGLSPKWSQRLQPIIQVVASFPAPMLFPLITLFLVFIHFPFTIGCVALMLLGTQWYILFNVIAGAMAIPGDLKEVGTVFGTGALKRWTRLYIPCVFPYLVTGLVTAAGGAWNATIVSEYVKVKDTTYVAYGIGSIISKATDDGNFPLLASATVALALSVVLLNRSFWKRMYRVAEDRYSLNV